MRIAMISTPFVAVPPGDYGGTELVVYELAEGLVERGQDVTVFAPGDSCTRAKLSFLYSQGQWPPSPLPEVNHVSWAMKQIADGDFDVIHAHSALALGMARLVPDIPLVYTLHHDCVEEFSAFYEYFPKIQFIAISENQRRLETPLPRCEVIHHGLDPDRFEFSAHADDYVCYLGRFTEEKGTHIAIDVAREAGLPIRVAGRAHPADQEFAEREMKHRLALPHVKNLGCVGVAQKVPLLRQARAMLAPLQWEEPFGLVLIEAMLSGCPVVAFPRGSAPELIEPGLTGFLVESAEEMVEVIRPGGRIESIDRLACRQRGVERFSRARLVENHLKLYRRVIAETTPRQRAAGGGNPDPQLIIPA
jgi:glycosyltransferase involved in cell wall biosynthesis